MRVLFLGTGTSHGVPMIGCDCDVCRSSDRRDKRSRPSIYVDLGGSCVLVDTTPDLRTQALEHNIRRVDAVLVTHAHADHIMGLDDIRPFNRFKGGAMPIHGAAVTLEALRRIFAYAFDPGPKGGGLPQLDLVPITGPFVINGHTVTPVPVQHGPWEVLGFRFGRFAYLTDCNGVSESSLALLHDLDVLVLDALRPAPHPTHFTLEQAIVMARRIGAKQTYFTHIAHNLGHEATSAKLPAGMALAYDGLSLDLRDS